MLRIEEPSLGRNCAGMSRRSFLQVGAVGAGLTLADQFRAYAAAPPKKKTACILIWLDGGPPQHETYDPKPEAPAEYKGAYNAIETSVKGLRFCELMTSQAKIAHKMAVIRSVHHDNGDHFAGAHMMLTGRWGATGANTTPLSPGIGSIVSKLRGANRPDLPAYVGLQNLHSVGLIPGYHGANYLGSQYDPFVAADDSGGKVIGTPTLFKMKTDRTRLSKRAGMLDRFDGFRRQMDQEAQVSSTDYFSKLALHTLTSPAVREAFDLDAETDKTAAAYGDHHWGRYTLLSRRLVERGVTFVTVNMDGWDMHDNIKDVVKGPAQRMDQSVGALISDLDQRGMLDSTLVMVMGEFGRTPKLNTTGVPGQTGLPGRDHWGQVMSVIMAGGGLRMGQAVGASNANGEYPAEKPYTPDDVLATMYHTLGINPQTMLIDKVGRPIPVLPEGEPIPELV